MDAEKKNIVDYRAMGAQLRSARKAKHITQQELGRMIGVSTSYIGHIERGIKHTSLETLVLLCRCLDLNLGEVVVGLTPDKDERRIIRNYLEAQLSTFCKD